MSFFLCMSVTLCAVLVVELNAIIGGPLSNMI